MAGNQESDNADEFFGATAPAGPAAGSSTDTENADVFFGVHPNVPTDSDGQPVMPQHAPAYMPPSDGLLKRLANIPAVFSAAVDGAKEGFGPNPVGLSPDTIEGLKNAGVFPDPTNGRTGIIRSWNEMWLKPAASFTDAAFRGMNAAVVGGAKAFGTVVGQVTNDESEGASAAREAENFANYLMLDGMSRGGGQIPLTRVDIGPTGKMTDLPLGIIPQAQDFKAAAVVSGDTTGISKAESTMKQLYKDEGLVPAEITHDINSDITIKQDLLTSEVPTAYVKPTVPEDLVEQFNQDQKLLEAGYSPDEIMKMSDDEITAALEPPKETGTDLTTIEPEPASAPEMKDITPSDGNGGGLPPRDEQKALPGSDNRPEMSFDEANDAVKDRIDFTGREQKEPMTFERLYTRLVDDLNPVKVAVRGALDRLGLKDKNLQTADDPYKLMRLARGASGKADRMIRFGTVDFHTLQQNGEGLEDILKSKVVDPTTGKEGRLDLKDFATYTVAKRSVELDKRGIETGVDPAAARITVQRGDKMYGEIGRRLVDFQNRVSKYMKDAGVISHEGYISMLDANKDYVPFHRWIEDENVAAAGRGGILKKLGVANPFKKIKGSDAKIVNPIETVIRNTYMYASLADKNAAGVKLVDLLRHADEGTPILRDLIPYPDKAPTEFVMSPHRLTDETGASKLLGDHTTRDLPGGGEVGAARNDRGPMLEAVKGEERFTDADFKDAGIEDERLQAVIRGISQPTDVKGNVISVLRDGKRESYRVNDSDLLAAWRGLDSSSAHIIMKVLGFPARTLRAGATLAPDFIGRNIIRDFFGAVVNSKGALFSPVDTAKGLVSAIRKDQDYKDWLASGGGNAQMVSLDRNYLQSKLRELDEQTGVASRAWNVVNSPIRALRLASELAENATRLGEFKKNVGNAFDKAALQKGAFESREVTLDFARMGSQIRAWNMISAFFNAGIQGTDRLARAFKENPAATTTKIIGGIMTPSALLWAANHNDPRYKEIPNWEKDLFWIVMTDDTIWRIPKPFETGVLFGSGFERTLDKYFGDNPHAYAGFLQSLTDVSMPSPIPTFATPIMEQFSNRSLFSGTQIIPDRLEKQVPEYQYNNYTSELAKGLGRIFSAFPGMRDAAQDGGGPFSGMAKAITTPILLENYIRDWTGGLGSYAMNLADLGLRKAGVLPDPPAPLATLADIPFIKAFVIRYPSAGAQSLQDFYDRNTYNKQVMTTFQTLNEAGDIDAAQTVIDHYGQRQSLDRLQTVIGQQSTIIRNIYKSPAMDKSDKRQLIDTLYSTMIQEAQQGNKILDEIDNGFAQFKAQKEAQQAEAQKQQAIQDQSVTGALTNPSNAGVVAPDQPAPKIEQQPGIKPPTIQ